MLTINDVTRVSKDIQHNVKAGHLGTIVHIFDQYPLVYEVEFTDDQGRTLATVPLKKENISLYWSASKEKNPK